MSSFVKTAVLGLGLMAGAAFAAQAQTSDLSALPPGGGPTPSVVVPSGHYPGPNPGSGPFIPTEPRQAAVAPTGAYPGPAPGATNGPMPPHFVTPPGYNKNPEMAPYTTNIGPKPN